MPITFQPAAHPANPYPVENITRHGYVQHILEDVCPAQYNQSGEILQSSFAVIDNSRILYPQRRGFVETVLQAYNHHQALVLSPDDIWLAILTYVDL